MNTNNNQIKIAYKLYVFISLMLFFSGSVDATDHNSGAWFGTFINKPLDEKYSLWAESQLRYGVSDGEMQQVLVRTGVLRTLNEKHEVGLLYLYAETGELKEHRIALQHVQKYGEFLDGFWSARTRLEGRNLEDNNDDSIRARYNLRYDFETEKYYAPIVSNEIFFNLTREEWTGDRLVDRNRLFLGMNFKLENLRFEAGYLNQYVPRSNNDIMEHLLLAYFYF